MPYDVQALKDAIKREERSIGSFEQAITNSRALIADYRRLIEEELERKANPPQVHVEVVHGDDDEE